MKCYAVIMTEIKYAPLEILRSIFCQASQLGQVSFAPSFWENNLFLF